MAVVRSYQLFIIPLSDSINKRIASNMRKVSVKFSLWTNRQYSICTFYPVALRVCTVQGLP